MGCLNDKDFAHWFGNIHLSGPCNRSCYFCIGQHMPDLLSYNNLDTWPLDGLDEFVDRCKEHGVTEINLTGSNTDPMLYKHIPVLLKRLKGEGFTVGVRTNGARLTPDFFSFDKASITICSFNQTIHLAMMGSGEPPKTWRLFDASMLIPFKVNVVLGPENKHDVINTLDELRYITSRVNLREPYGQPHVGNPFVDREPDRLVHGMPLYRINDIDVVYWDVHYTEVSSVNLFASGRISEDYSITKGSGPNGAVHDQAYFTEKVGVDNPE